MKPNEAIEILNRFKIIDSSITLLDEIGFEHLQERYRTQNQALDYAIELAKRDEGMKVKTDLHLSGVNDCPICGNLVFYSSNFNFCGYCGKHLDWSDVK